MDTRTTNRTLVLDFKKQVLEELKRGHAAIKNRILSMEQISYDNSKIFSENGIETQNSSSAPVVSVEVLTNEMIDNDNAESSEYFTDQTQQQIPVHGNDQNDLQVGSTAGTAVSPPNSNNLYTYRPNTFLPGHNLLHGGLAPSGSLATLQQMQQFQNQQQQFMQFPTIPNMQFISQNDLVISGKKDDDKGTNQGNPQQTTESQPQMMDLGSTTSAASSSEQTTAQKSDFAQLPPTPFQYQQQQLQQQQYFLYQHQLQQQLLAQQFYGQGSVPTTKKQSKKQREAQAAQMSTHAAAMANREFFNPPITNLANFGNIGLSLNPRDTQLLSNQYNVAVQQHLQQQMQMQQGVASQQQPNNLFPSNSNNMLNSGGFFLQNNNYLLGGAGGNSMPSMPTQLQRSISDGAIASTDSSNNISNLPMRLPKVDTFASKNQLFLQGQPGGNFLYGGMGLTPQQQNMNTLYPLNSLVNSSPQTASVTNTNTSSSGSNKKVAASLYNQISNSNNKGGGGAQGQMGSPYNTGMAFMQQPQMNEGGSVSSDPSSMHVKPVLNRASSANVTGSSTKPRKGKQGTGSALGGGFNNSPTLWEQIQPPPTMLQLQQQNQQMQMQQQMNLQGGPQNLSSQQQQQQQMNMTSAALLAGGYGANPDLFLQQQRMVDGSMGISAVSAQAFQKNATAPGGSLYVKPPKEPKVSKDGKKSKKERTNSNLDPNSVLGMTAMGIGGAMIPNNSPFNPMSTGHIGGYVLNKDGTYSLCTSLPGTGYNASVSGLPGGGLLGNSVGVVPVQMIPKESKEESANSLNKRRDIASAKLAAIENSKMLARKSIALSAQSANQPRRKVQWDYLLEEVQYMAIDFRQERKWMMAAAKSVATECAEVVALKRRQTAAEKQLKSSTYEYLNSDVYKESLKLAKQVAVKISGLVASRWLAAEREVLSMLSGSSADSVSEKHFIRPSMLRRIEELLLRDSCNYIDNTSRALLQQAISSAHSSDFSVKRMLDVPAHAIKSQPEVILSVKAQNGLIDRTIDKVLKNKPVVVTFSVTEGGTKDDESDQMDVENESSKTSKPSLCLLPHQTQLLEGVSSLENSHSFGSVVIVKQPNVGTTTALIHLTHQWMCEDREVERNAVDNMAVNGTESQMLESMSSRVVLLVVPRKRLYKYMSLYATHFPEVKTILYRTSSTSVDDMTNHWNSLVTSAVNAVLIVCLENMSHFMATSALFFNNLTMSFLCGVVIDVRASDVLSAVVLGGADSKSKEKKRHSSSESFVDLSSWLAPLVAALIPRKATVHRVIVNNAQLTTSQFDIVAILSYLVPQISHAQWSEKYPINRVKPVSSSTTGKSAIGIKAIPVVAPVVTTVATSSASDTQHAGKKKPELSHDDPSAEMTETETDFPHIDYINKNTVNQMICNISVSLKTIVYPLVTFTKPVIGHLSIQEELICVEMSSAQRKKYKLIISLFSGPNQLVDALGGKVDGKDVWCNSYSDGSNTANTAAMIMLLSRVCFDESLVSISEDRSNSNKLSVLPVYTTGFSAYPDLFPSTNSLAISPRNSSVFGRSHSVSSSLGSFDHSAFPSDPTRMLATTAFPSPTRFQPLPIYSSVESAALAVASGTGMISSENLNGGVGVDGAGVPLLLSGPAAGMFAAEAASSQAQMIIPRHMSFDNHGVGSTNSVSSSTGSMNSGPTAGTAPPFYPGKDSSTFQYSSGMLNTLNYPTTSSVPFPDISQSLGAPPQGGCAFPPFNMGTSVSKKEILVYNGSCKPSCIASSKSCKGKWGSLLDVLNKLSSKKVVLLVESSEEIRVIQSFLKSRKVAFLSTMRTKEDTNIELSTLSVDAIFSDIYSQHVISQFNSLESTVNVLLTTSNVFCTSHAAKLTPNTVMIDAVVVFSSEWLPKLDSSTSSQGTLQKIKDSLYVLSSARSDKKPIQLIQIVYKDTIEEAMSRKNGNILALQGTNITELFPSAPSTEACVDSLPIVQPTSSVSLAESDPVTFLHKAPVLKSLVTPLSTVTASTETKISVGDRSTPTVPQAAPAPAPPVRSSGFGGKGTIILGPQGTTTFMKSNNEDGGHANTASTPRGGVRRSGVSENATNLAKAAVMKWISEVRQEYRKVLNDFKLREKVVRSCPSTAITVVNSTIKTEDEFSSGKDIANVTPDTSIVTSSDKEAEEECLDTCHNKEFLCILRETRKSLLDNSTDWLTQKSIVNAHIENLFSSADLNLSLGLITQYATKISERIQVLEGNSHLCNCNNLYDFYFDNDNYAYDVNLPIVAGEKRRRGKVLSTAERNRLLIANQTKTHIIRKSDDEFDEVPNFRTHVMPIPNLIYSENGNNTAVVSPLTKPRCFYTFTELLIENQRRGIEMDTELFVNPLMTATRNDVFTTPSYLESRRNADKCDNNMIIQYLHEKVVKPVTVKKVRNPYTKKKNQDGTTTTASSNNNNGNNNSGNGGSGGGGQENLPSATTEPSTFMDGSGGGGNGDVSAFQLDNDSSIFDNGGDVFDNNQHSMYSQNYALNYQHQGTNNTDANAQFKGVLNTRESNNSSTQDIVSGHINRFSAANPNAPSNALTDDYSRAFEDEMYLYDIKEEKGLNRAPPAPTNKRQREKEQLLLKQKGSQHAQLDFKMEDDIMSPNQNRNSISNNAFLLDDNMLSEFSPLPDSLKLERNVSSSSGSGGNSKKKARKYSHGSFSNLTAQEAAAEIQQEFQANYQRRASMQSPATVEANPQPAVVPVRLDNAAMLQRQLFPHTTAGQNGSSSSSSSSAELQSQAQEISSSFRAIPQSDHFSPPTRAVTPRATTSRGNTPSGVEFRRTRSPVNTQTEMSSTVEEGSWVTFEDDLIICMQSAISDAGFIKTAAWLNKSKAKHGWGEGTRTASEARARYATLCSDGRTQIRLQDYKIINTIATLRKSAAVNTEFRSTSSSTHNSTADNMSPNGMKQQEQNSPCEITN